MNYEIPKEAEEKVKKYLLEYFEGEKIERTNQSQDINGADYIITNSNGLYITVDVKSSKKTYIDEEGYAKIVLEWRHENKGGELTGWSLLPNKNTHYIAYYYEDTNKCIILPFHILRKTFKDNLKKYLNMCYMKPYVTHTKNEHGEIKYATYFFGVSIKIFQQDMFKITIGEQSELQRQNTIK